MRLKELIADMWKKSACQRGKHRWSEGYTKTEKETFHFRFCQSCQIREALDVRQRSDN
jgi:hypothetical protein